eukprot:Skav221287  [mRNA]  locus=scaffold2775:226436:227902:+ [translate_table: standard]
MAADREPFLQMRNDGKAHLTVPELNSATPLTDAIDVTGGHEGGVPLHQPRKMAFDGCGVTDGFCGTVCAKGLRRQCRLVRRQADTRDRLQRGQLEVVQLWWIWWILMFFWFFSREKGGKVWKDMVKVRRTVD